MDYRLWPNNRAATLLGSSLQKFLQKSKIRAGGRVVIRARLLVGA